MPNPLPERAQRAVFIGLIAVLVVFGLYLSLGGFGGGDEEGPAASEEPGASPSGATDPAAPGGLSTVEPSPIDTTAEEDVDVLDWFPFTEEELRAAGATARTFAEAYGTIDYTGSPESYYASMEALATDEYARVLVDASRAGAFWEEMSEVEAVAQGRAEVDSVRTYGSDSITFVVTAQSITETADAEFDEELGEFAVTVVRGGGAWQVFDFQPADAGQFGEE
ncbi:hypothetical protein OUQ99_26620 [Streptomonospora nanhaiensis]|uniref:Uncharacterized protein n=1 Tax=Streptomonospora nanhaiensis TaxID=1323731 RepID=A0ABY6YKG9_9ACTN|nr:hypothetical protein [Streptomonospora nanhaiensis]WAE72718.1 hypothetical protein OUQ99_26620 [Streptomonospora nanhaiensis]